MSNEATHKLNEVARQLLVHEAARRADGGGERAAAFQVCEALRGPLRKLMGVAGFRSLLSRALTLAGTEVHWLREIQIGTNGSLEGLDDIRAKLGARRIEAGEIALVAQLLGLLETFIGPVLTLSLLRDIWPKMENGNKQTRGTP